MQRMSLARRNGPHSRPDRIGLKAYPTIYHLRSLGCGTSQPDLPEEHGAAWIGEG